MTAKEYLLGYRQAYKRAKMIEARIEEYCRGMGGLKAIEYSDMPKAHNVERDLSDEFVKLDEMNWEWRQRAGECRQIMRDICRRIDGLGAEKDKADEAQVLELRYIAHWIDSRGREQVGLLPWEAIAARMGYEKRQVQRIHGMALQHIEIPEEMS